MAKLLQVLEIPSHYLENATGKVVNDWRFPGHGRWRTNSEFLKGLKEGINGSETGFSSFMNELCEPTIPKNRTSRAFCLEGSASFIDQSDEDYEKSDQMSFLI